MMPYLSFVNEKDFIDMDTLERTRCVSESSAGGTSGYNSTTSPGPGTSPVSSRLSPNKSPDTFLQTEFSHLDILPVSYIQSTGQYMPLENESMNKNTIYQPQNMNFSVHLNAENQQELFTPSCNVNIKYEYEATLRVTEQPVEKFRFRYKSEMHGTHGFLYGVNSIRNKKTHPEVELCGYNGPAIIRCSLFQTNLDSPHSHQLLVRKDDHDVCDPHELEVSQDLGYFAQFQNMGIIHTAKKFIVEELLKKKRKRLGRDMLTTKGEQELVKQTEREAKDMNLNQVRLCFEAFRVEADKSFTPIAPPVYSNPINNRKSAQTGELRITRLSIATGNVAGNDDLILLVEKVSKKNIKVRFYEMVDDEQVWEAFATFRESDVHHQYAIVCRTPPYKDRDIDKAVEVFIELVRPSDDERSYPPVSFRYKPSYAAISRKRRRTCSSFNSGSCNNSGSLSSGEIPKTVQEQQKSLNLSYGSDEINKLINNTGTDSNKFDMSLGSDFLKFLIDPKTDGLDALDNIESGTRIEKDGICTSSKNYKKDHYKKLMICKKQIDMAKQSGTEQHSQIQSLNLYVKRITNVFNDTFRSVTPANPTERNSAAEQVSKILNEYSKKHGDSLIHEIVMSNNFKFAMQIFKILNDFQLNELCNSMVNKQNQTALHYACLYDQPNYIRPLLKLGCNPNIQDSEGNTALHIAVRENHLKCLESFINSEMAFNLSSLNDDGFTPLHLAIRDSNLEIVEKILKFDGSTVVTTPCSKDGSNALHMAVQQQNLKLVNLILKNCCTLSSILYTNNRAGYTPLDLAKQLVTSDERAKQILSLLLTFYDKYPLLDKTQRMDISTSTEGEDKDQEIMLIIKEEEYSCSSSEDDEDDNNSESSVKPTKVTNAAAISSSEIIKDSGIKQELPEDCINIIDLELALNNKKIFSKLSVKLNEDEKWKKLASDMEISAFYLTNAEAFLNSLKRNLKSVNCAQLTLSLQSIDNRLIDLILNS